MERGNMQRPNRLGGGLRRGLYLLLLSVGFQGDLSVELLTGLDVWSGV